MRFLRQMPAPKKKSWLRRRQQMVGVFGGYNHNLRIQENEWYEEENMSAVEYPLLCTRRNRVTEFTYPANKQPLGVANVNGLAYLYGDRVHFTSLNGTEYDEGSGVSSLYSGARQLVKVGSLMTIWPDKVAVSLVDERFYNIKPLWGSVTISFGTVTVTLCRQDGTDYGAYTSAATAPENPSNGDMWMDTSNADVPVLKEYSAASGMWVTIPTTYLKVAATMFGMDFSQYDGVEFSGFTGALESLNGSHILYGVDRDYVVITSILKNLPLTQTATASSEIQIQRKVPDMDFVVECGNRLWGCKYGMVDGKFVNEIYASKLGDPTNWNCFMGLSTDSWVASRGATGEFTGAAVLQGHPLFFRENCVEKVFPSDTGAHQVVTTECRGIQRGSWRSAVIVNETLYYKSISDVMAYTGALPYSVSEALGDTAYSDARAGAVDGVLYISMKDAAGGWHMFTYDTAKRIWNRQDSTKAMMFAEVDGVLYFIDETEDTKYLMRCNGDDSGDITWSVTSGVVGLAVAENKYVSRYVIRLATDGSVRLEVKYDNGRWIDKGTTAHNGLGSVVIPVMPQRCDHMQFRLSGTRHCRIYSIAKYVQQGSDVHW